MSPTTRTKPTPKRPNPTMTHTDPYSGWRVYVAGKPTDRLYGRREDALAKADELRDQIAACSIPMRGWSVTVAWYDSPANA